MKTQIVLTLFNYLVCGKTICRNDFCVRFGISCRTFYRYVREISCFLRGSRPDCVIDVSREGAEYRLKNCTNNGCE